MAVLVDSNCCSVRGSCTAASPADAAAGSVLCSCIGCRSATGTVSSWDQAKRGCERLTRCRFEKSVREQIGRLRHYVDFPILEGGSIYEYI